MSRACGCADHPRHSTLVRLSCLEDDAQGEPLEILWEREVDARILGAGAWNTVASRGFDAPRLFSAYLHTLRWNCVTATDAKLFQAPYRAGIEVKAYQLEPLRKALGMPRVNLFIADDVGLGKTIEAGLILREMLLRQKVRRTVISCPPSVVRQWHDEMEQRYGLTFIVYDRDYVAAKRQERGYGVNPWTTHNRFIISHALLRDETYAAPLRDWLGAFADASLLILDEAHNAAPLFLSATPHNGHSNSFSALLEILDPQRFCRGVAVHPKLRDAVMVRRLKVDLRDGGEEFPERDVVRVDVEDLPDDAPELALSRLLQRYRKAREKRLADATRSQQAAAMLVVTSLQKRLLSSIEAFARTLKVHRDAIARQADRQADGPEDETADETESASEEWPLLFESPGADDERSDLDEQEVTAEEDVQMTAASRRTAGPADGMAPELALLDEMAAIAERARYDQDPRVAHLVDWIRDNLCPDLGKPDARWLDRRVLVFTEYTDPKRYLEQQLETALAGSDRERERVMTFHGGMGEERREAVKAAFNTDPARHPLRILIATDAAREGVNLQNHCADLFHFDIPWNPSRMEQRNGRIDRKLQRARKVRCHYYVLPQRAEDRVLDVLVAKTARIHRELGSLSPVVERRLDRLLGDGIRHEREPDLTESIRTVDQEPPSRRGRARMTVVDEELEETRERHDKLEAQLARLDEMLKLSRDWIGLDDRHFRDALSAALEVMGAEALEPLDAAEAARDPSAPLPSRTTTGGSRRRFRSRTARGAAPSSTRTASSASTWRSCRRPRRRGGTPAGRARRRTRRTPT